MLVLELFSGLDPLEGKPRPRIGGSPEPPRPRPLLGNVWMTGGPLTAIRRFGKPITSQSSRFLGGGRPGRTILSDVGSFRLTSMRSKWFSRY